MRFVSALLLLLSSIAFGESKSSIAWVNAFDIAEDHARTEARPLLIEFWASWCGPCKEMDQRTWSDPRVVQMSKRYVAAAVNVDRDQATASRYNAHVLPTVIVTDPWGHVLARREGFMHAADLAALLASVPSDYSGARASHEALERNAKDAVALAEMGRFYVKANAPVFAREFYNAALKCKECDAKLRCDLALAIGINEIGMHDWNAARKALRQFLKEYPEGPHRDKALLGLVIADARQGKKADAQKTLAELESKYPSSADTDTARKILSGQ